MGLNYGKDWEEKFKEDARKVEGFTVMRLYDQVSGYKTVSRNPSDFIAYKFPNFFFIECKSVEGNTFPFSNFRQYDIMKGFANMRGINAGALIWFVDHKKVCWVDIDEFIRLKELGAKSINIKMIGDNSYNIYEIPSTIKRVFPTCDYNKLIEIANEKLNKI